MSQPAALNSSGVSVLTEPAVPTGMKAGVRTSPCEVVRRPARAAVVASVPSSSNPKAIAPGRAGKLKVRTMLGEPEGGVKTAESKALAEAQRTPGGPGSEKAGTGGTRIVRVPPSLDEAAPGP